MTRHTDVSEHAGRYRYQNGTCAKVISAQMVYTCVYEYLAINTYAYIYIYIYVCVYVYIHVTYCHAMSSNISNTMQSNILQRSVMCIYDQYISSCRLKLFVLALFKTKGYRFLGNPMATPSFYLWRWWMRSTRFLLMTTSTVESHVFFGLWNLTWR